MLLEIDRKVYNLTPAQNIKARRCPTATNLQRQTVIVTNKRDFFSLDELKTDCHNTCIFYR